MTDPAPRATYVSLLKEIKARIAQAQTRAVLSVNAELIQLYWDIGRMIDSRQQAEGWGAGVIPRLARELHGELSDAKGFSERNIKRMLAFYREYPDPADISPPAAASLPAPKKGPKVAADSKGLEKVPQPAAQKKGLTKVPQLAAQKKGLTKVPQLAAQFPDALLWTIPWFHHIILIEKLKDRADRVWYMQQTLANGWSRNVLLLMVKSEAHRRQGKAVTNFDRILPAPKSNLVRQALKDPYIFDFLTLEEPFHERELETNLLHQVERFLLELGHGFAFVGRQFPLEVGDSDFYIDLLFYHLKLRCFVVIDLKKGEFKPEYAGKMNFYLAVVDDKLRHESDAPSIGLVLCQDRNQVVAEYALRGVSTPIGISEYELTRALPASLKSALPTVEEIEAELGEAPAEKSVEDTSPPSATKSTVSSAKNSTKNKKC